jgi:hypothetical protein
MLVRWIVNEKRELVRFRDCREYVKYGGVQAELGERSPRLVPRRALKVWPLMDHPDLVEQCLSLIDKYGVTDMVGCLDVVPKHSLKLLNSLFYGQRHRFLISSLALDLTDPERLPKKKQFLGRFALCKTVCKQTL